MSAHPPARRRRTASAIWAGIGERFLPVALRDATGPSLPLARLLRLSLFQVSVGMAVALVVGTLNRVMIVELGVASRLVATMVALPLVLAPLRALIGFRSDHHRSVLGWRRTPFLWIGTMLQFGGLALMPFALLVLSGIGGGHAVPMLGGIAAAAAFLLIGAGMHTVQTVGLALATDLAPEEARPRVVALLCLMLLVGVLVSALCFGVALAAFDVERLIQVIQTAAVLTVLLNGAALWKQERLLDRGRAGPQAAARPRPRFRAAWASLRAVENSGRRLLVVAIGTVAFSLQDVLLEPYGGEVLRLPVAATTALTAMLALGGIAGFATAARRLAGRIDRHRLAAEGVLAGLAAFTLVMFAAPFGSAAMFAIGTALIGFGAAMFLVGTLNGAIDGIRGGNGLALGTWGAVQSFAAGGAVALGGWLRDACSHLRGFDAALSFETVYALEIVLLLATLVAIGPLVRFAAPTHGALSPRSA